MKRLIQKVLRKIDRRPKGKRLENLVLESGLFDEAFYFNNHGAEISKTGFSPIEHFCRIGGNEGLEPSERFSSSRYLTDYPDVRKAGINPLVHYLLYGRTEGRPTWPVSLVAPRPRCPANSVWNDLALRFQEGGRLLHKTSSIIDIVVPIQEGLHETANCIYRVLESKLKNNLECELVVVHDHSLDQDLSRLLEELGSRGLLTILKNERAIGVVGSANRAMQLHASRDVILLSSNTEVFGDWIDRLYRAAHSQRDIGTVTPLSNNADICSYPNSGKNFEEIFELPFDEIDNIARQANAELKVEIPAAIGFCTYVRRESLAECGYFDANAFGDCAGAENDFSLRIAARGWRNILAGDVFVRHFGQISPGSASDGRTAAGLEIIGARHPDYLKAVDNFRKMDPPRQMRQNIDVARIRKANGPLSVLFVLHDLGGGTLRHVNDMSARLPQEGVGVVWMQPAQDGKVAVITHPKIKNLSSGLELEISDVLTDAAAVLKRLGVGHIHVHHTLGYTRAFPEWIMRLASLCRVGYDLTVHDYFMQCPRIYMIDGSGKFCGNTDLEVCESCVATEGSPVGHVNVTQWRATYRNFLQGARRRFVPNDAVKALLTELVPSVEFEVREHPENIPTTLNQPLARRSWKQLHVAVIGAMLAHKGSNVLVQCALDAEKRRLPITFHLFGYSDWAGMNRLSNVRVIGKYDERDLQPLLRNTRCHIAFFPAVWPETYSYTLSEAWFASLYPVAFDMGAIAERIRRAGWGHLLPTRIIENASAINDALLALRPPPLPRDFPGNIPVGRYGSLLQDYYGIELGALSAE